MKSIMTTEQLSCDAFIGGHLRIYQPRDGYRAGSDAVFLAASCPATSGQSVLELGCGVGVASLCLAWRVPKIQITGIELQPRYAELAQRNATSNGIEMEVICGNLEAAANLTDSRIFDHVIMNPPYFAPGSRPGEAGRDLALNYYGGLKPWIRGGLARLRPSGFLTVIHRVDRLADILALLNSRADGIEIKPLAARVNRLPKLSIIRARKGSHAGTTLFDPLILHEGEAHDADRDDYSQAARAILRDGEELMFH